MFRRTVVEILLPGVVTVESVAPLGEAFAAMRDNKTGALLVTREGKPVGFFTEHEVLVKAKDGLDFSTAQVKDVMTRRLVGVSRDEFVDTVCLLLEKHRVRHVAVLDEKGAVSGMVTYTDIVRAHGMEYLVSNMTCQDIMRSGGLVLALKQEPLIEVIGRMLAGEQSCALTVIERKPEGIVTERDITRFVGEGGNPATAKVGDLMRAPVMTVPLDAVVYKTIMYMNQMGVRRVVVADADGNLAGLVSEAEIMNGIKQLQ